MRLTASSVPLRPAPPIQIGTPSEEGVRQDLAAALRSTLVLQADSVQYEHPTGGSRIDLWIDPSRLAIEVKFHRPIRSGHKRPVTQLLRRPRWPMRSLPWRSQTRRPRLRRDDAGGQAVSSGVEAAAPCEAIGRVAGRELRGLAISPAFGSWSG